MPLPRLTGGAFVINILVEREFAEPSAASPLSFELATPSGSGQEVSFCGTCGTTLWSRYRVAPGHLLFVRAGTLDTPEAIEPDVHIYVRTKLPWLELPTGARAFEAIYETEKVWTAASRERVRRHLRGGPPPPRPLQGDRNHGDPSRSAGRRR